MRAEAQNLKNSGEYFKINSAKKDGGCNGGFNLAAIVVNEGTRVAKSNF